MTENFIIFLPRRTIECDELLLKHSLINPEKIHQIAIDLVQLDEDLLSMELPESFANHLLDDDDNYKIYVH